MLNDPVDQTCATCIWWERGGARLANAERDPSCGPSVGTCQLRAPSVVQTHSSFPVTMYPQTHESRFCGEWEGVDADPDGGGGEKIIAFPVANRVAA